MRSLSLSFSLAYMLWSLSAGQQKKAKTMTKVNRTDSPAPPYLTAATVGFNEVVPNLLH